MAEERAPMMSTPTTAQLGQERVRLSQAAGAFSRPGEDGRVPIVVIPERVILYLNAPIIAAGAILIAGILADALLSTGFLTPLALIAAVGLVGFGILRWFYIIIPEGVNGLIVRVGRYERTLASGFHLLPPYYTISHLVTRREIPFDVPIAGARTADDVRARVDTLVVFSITDPARFVFRISAPDFDQIFQAACQEALRALVHEVAAERLGQLVGAEAESARALLESVVAPYGVAVHRIIITFAMLPEEFIRSQEERQLAIIQRAEQEERQALAEIRLADTEDLSKQQVLAQAEREMRLLEAQLQVVAARGQLVDQEALVEARRLARMEERLQQSPLAARWELKRARLEVSRALAGNTRAIVQMGGADGVARLLAVRDVLGEAPAADADHPEGLDTADAATGLPSRTQEGPGD